MVLSYEIVFLLAPLGDSLARLVHKVLKIF